MDTLQSKLESTRAIFCCEVGAWHNNSTHDTNLVFLFCLCAFPQGSHQCVNRWSVWRPPEILSGPPTPALWASRCLVSEGSFSFPLPLQVCVLSFNVRSIDVSAALSSPQACGPTGQTALTSTLSAGITIRASWLLETTLGRSIYSHTPVHSSG